MGRFKFLLFFCPVLVLLAVVLFFVHPLAPLVLLLSVLIQLPIVYIISQVNMNKGYEDRAFARKTQHEKDKDAAAWLQEEEKEAAGAGFKYWSKRAKSLSALNRAQLLLEMEMPRQAAALLAQVQENKIDKINRQRFLQMVEKLQMESEK